MNKTSSIKINFIYNTIYQILSMIVPLITTPYLARVLGAEKIGIFSYSFSIVYYFGLFAMLGVNNYGNRSIAQTRDDKTNNSKTFWGIYLFQLISSIIMVIIYSIYVIAWCDDKIIGWIMVIYIVSAGIDVNWFFFGLEKFKITTIRNVFVKSFTVFGVFVLVKRPSDVYMYAFIYVFGQLVSQIVLWISVRKYIHPCKITAFDIIRHVKPNLILFIPVLGVSLYKIMDKIMLGAMASKVEVGFYESSERVIQVPIALITSLGTVMLPRISNLIANDEKEKSENYLQKSLTFAVFLASSMGFGIMAVAKEFVPIFYGDGYDKCIILFQILLPSCIFLAFANVLRTQFLIPNKMDKSYMVSIFSGACINLLVNAMLIPYFEAVGAAIGTLLAEFTVCFVQCYYVRKYINLYRYIKKSIPYIVAGIVMYVVVYIIPLSLTSTVLTMLVKICIGAIIYLIIISPKILSYLRHNKYN